LVSSDITQRPAGQQPLTLTTTSSLSENHMPHRTSELTLQGLYCGKSNITNNQHMMHPRRSQKQHSQYGGESGIANKTKKLAPPDLLNYWDGGVLLPLLLLVLSQ
jgi:hypothetical protein